MARQDYPELELISHKLCPYVQRARITLAEKDVPHAVQFIDLANKPHWFTAVSPLGKVPVLLVNGHPLFESQVIAEFIDEIGPGSLLPTDPLERAHHRSWAAFASNMLDTVAQFYNADDPIAFTRALENLSQRFRRLETVLGDGPWFAGNNFSLVDAAFAPVFRYFDTFEQFGDFDWFEDLSRVPAWRSQLRDRPSVEAAVVPHYPQLLENFLLARRSVLGRLMQRQVERKSG